jgi:hypothetical protein
MKKNHKADYALKAQAMKTKASFCQRLCQADDGVKRMPTRKDLGLAK